MVSIMKNTIGDFEDISPQEILDFACELEDIKDDLSSTNAEINRTIYVKIYYAVFIFLREWLKKHMNYVSLKGEHTKLPNFIRFRGPFTYDKNKELSEDLILLKKLRHQADYYITVPSQYSSQYKKWNFTSIVSAFEIAEDIIESFNKFKSL